jgi:FKBP-type peptidyl-prolyl cis-trans isomerase
VLRRSLLVLMLALAVTACGGDDDNNPNTPTPTPQGPATLVVEDLTIGTGAEATGGRLLTVNYILYLYDPAGNGGRGRQLEGPAQFQFRQGTNAVIQGFEQGTASMLVGGVRRLTIPPSLAYGASGNPQGGIPGNSWIVFDVQLVSVAD